MNNNNSNNDNCFFFLLFFVCLVFSFCLQKFSNVVGHKGAATRRHTRRVKRRDKWNEIKEKPSHRTNGDGLWNMVMSHVLSRRNDKVNEMRTAYQIDFMTFVHSFSAVILKRTTLDRVLSSHMQRVRTHKFVPGCFSVWQRRWAHTHTHTLRFESDKLNFSCSLLDDGIEPQSVRVWSAYSLEINTNTQFEIYLPNNHDGR